jgi:hypothetical protein
MFCDVKGDMSVRAAFLKNAEKTRKDSNYAVPELFELVFGPRNIGLEPSFLGTGILCNSAILYRLNHGLMCRMTEAGSSA